MPVAPARITTPVDGAAWLNNTTLTLGLQNVFDFRSAVCGWTPREQLRHLACPRSKAGSLVFPAKEKILEPVSSADEWDRLFLTTERRSLRQSNSSVQCSSFFLKTFLSVVVPCIPGFLRDSPANQAEASCEQHQRHPDSNSRRMGRARFLRASAKKGVDCDCIDILK